MGREDLRRVSRRELLEAFGMAAGAAVAGGCGDSSPTSPSAVTTSTGTTAACTVTAPETAGPYPDQTGMLGNMAFYRRDVTEGRTGLPLALTITIVNVAANCAAVSGAAVEIWQCDAEGHYSEYAQPGYNGVGQTFLRGLQTTDGNGQVTFATIYPGWYAGRATHVHVEIYVNGRSAKTTQITFPEDVTAQVYQTGVYASKGQNTVTNSSDNVFSDGTSTEVATLAGSALSGYVATLTIGISV
jgi:protocatechuate 3,4-dioxygenase beta subunit